MKQLIEITDEDVISVINRIHVSMENKIISRKGIHGLALLIHLESAVVRQLKWQA